MSHGHGDMDMGDGSGGMSMMMMVPYLHFAGGDTLFFKSWQPSSPAAIAGASVGLFFLALFERFFSVMRSVMEAHWRRRAASIMQTPSCHETKVTSPLLDQNKDAAQSSDEISVSNNGIQETSRRSSQQPTRPRRRFQRTIAPFIPSHDFARGAMYAGQTLLAYILMLAVMTFQAAYIISIIVGLAMGEILFGRIGVRHDFAH
ncbi:hypothetical protein HGRIS_007648 [Hohenbuehelia grisea]|uniref:Copper transport protein n=1 Tax=Hohenbuehelia grisea TaxID=104357 RepID=A0ABR3J5I0_9AGAR